ncbi:hypothetical protein HSX10_12640 [Winogradskyella undariae]|uniref:hypothetical protein n=1 Tax=Winogradskyella undariae TaxID=1285465 RepID=UPI00156B32AB|nr:hypothetical protein [Winogradskyella undariae]NRR92417.1 hypothetical protein [Winogradskyella undariae]
MEDFLNTLPIKKILAGVFMVLLVFSGFFKEHFLYSKSEKKVLRKLGDKTNNKLSGKMVTALIYFTITIVALAIGLVVYST